MGGLARPVAERGPSPGAFSHQLLLPLDELPPPPENPLDLALAAPILAPAPLLPLAAVPLPRSRPTGR